jgi:hypothetical protein
MGIFSTKKRHYAFTSAVRVIEDSQVPDMRQKILISSVARKKPLNTAFIEQVAGASYRKFERMYSYAKDGRYTFGLPNAYVYTDTDGADIALAVLEAEVGAPVTVEYLRYRPLNNFFMGWKALLGLYGYSPDSNILINLSAYVGFPVYLDKIVAVHSSAAGIDPEFSALGSFDVNSQAGYTPERPAHTSVSGLGALSYIEEMRIGDTETESVELYVLWDNPAQAGLQRYTIVVDLSMYPSEDEYYHAKYTYEQNGVTHTGYWLYDPKTGSSPALNALFDHPTVVNPGTYFPFVIFRSYGYSRADPAYIPAAEIASAEEMLDIIGMDFQEIAASIHSQPGIEDVVQAVMMMGVPLNTENQIELEYLHSYFKRLSEALPQAANYYNLRDVDRARSFESVPTGLYAIRFTDADFHQILSFDGLARSLKAGDLPEEYTNILTVTQARIEDVIVQLVFSPYFTKPEVPVQFNRYFRRQIRPGVYEEIVISNLRLTVMVQDQVRSPVEAPGDTLGLLIPLDYELVRDMSAFKRESLYFRSLHLVFNSHIEQKVKWYETVTFRNLLFLAAVVITVLSVGTTWETIPGVAALGGAVAGTALAFFQIVLMDTLIALGLQLAIAKLAEVAGVEVVVVLAIAAAVYGGYKAFETGKLVMSATAKNMLAASAALTDGAGAYLKGAMADLQAESLKDGLKQDALWEELEAVTTELASHSHIDLYEDILRAPITMHGESPQDFYSRTVESGNVGARALDIIENFVAISLRLPSIEDTLGDSFS